MSAQPTLHFPALLRPASRDLPGRAAPGRRRQHPPDPYTPHRAKRYTAVSRSNPRFAGKISAALPARPEPRLVIKDHHILHQIFPCDLPQQHLIVQRQHAGEYPYQPQRQNQNRQVPNNPSFSVSVSSRPFHDAVSSQWAAWPSLQRDSLNPVIPLGGLPWWRISA